MNEQLAFLRSPRFWAIILGALSVYLESKGYIGESERNLIATIVAGFVTVRTIDRVSDKQLEVAEVVNTSTTVSMPSGVTEVKATTKE